MAVPAFAEQCGLLMARWLSWSPIGCDGSDLPMQTILSDEVWTVRCASKLLLDAH